MRLSRISGLLAGLCAAFVAGAAAAQTLNPTAAGSYSTTAANFSGGSGSPTGNLITGVQPALISRGYLIYSIPAGGTITSATLSLNASGIVDGPNTVNLYEVTTSPTLIANGTAPAAATHTDFGDGAVFGTAVATVNNETLTFVLTPAGIAALNAAQGSTIAFGLSNQTAAAASDFVFGSSINSTPRTLTLVTAPPATIPTLSEWAMILFGVLLAGGAAVYIQRRRLTA